MHCKDPVISIEPFHMKKEMFYGANQIVFKNAKHLRNQPTDAERVLWMHLRTRPGVFKFRRQHPAGNYILDFYCHSLKMAIEIDGSIPDQESIKGSDKERQAFLESDGIRFLQFSNEAVLKEINKVLEKIHNTIEEYSNQ